MVEPVMKRVDKRKKIMMVGVMGSGMSALAELFIGAGSKVVGADAKAATRKLNDIDFPIMPSDRALKYVEEVDEVVYSDAAERDIVVKRADEKGIRTISYHEALANLAKRFNVTAVSGTHGKSSTTAMLAHILIEANMDPTVLVGASVVGWPRGGARIGQEKYFILEADEYKNHYLSLNPNNIIITNVDFDHPDFFTSFDEVVNSYNEFIGKMKDGWLVTNQETYRNKDVVWPAKIMLADGVRIPENKNLAGDHMRGNAAMAVCMAEKIGVDREQAIKSLDTYRGLSRRMEKLGKIKNMSIFSDYGHHPREISATMKSVKKVHYDKKILAVFEPHTEERLEKMSSDFIKALEGADGLVVVPIYRPPGREGKDCGQLKNDFIEKLKNKAGVGVWVFDNLEEAPEILTELGDDFDIAIAFTAGDLDYYLREYVKEKD